MWEKDFEDSDYPAVLSDLTALVEEHSAWISRDCLNLVSAHNVMSPQARAMLSSGLADRIMAGRIGNRDHAGSRFIDRIEEICIAVARRLFGARFVEYRPMSGTISNGISIYAITRPGDGVLAWPKKYGGHFTFQDEGYPFYRNLKVSDIPCEGDDVGLVDFGSLGESIATEKPSAIILGSSTALFPFPLKRIADLASEAGAKVMYDGAHVMGLIAGGVFQDPLREGAALLSGSTQKTIPGPVGGLILTNDQSVATSVQLTADRLITNYQNNRVASLTVALLELSSFGRSLADKVVMNARALAGALSKQGLVVLCKRQGFTASHQLLVDASGLGGATDAVKRLEDANILSTRIPIPSDYPSHTEAPGGLRFGTNEVTRFGMGPKEMRAIAQLITRTIADREDPRSIRKEVLELKRPFDRLRFAFGSSD